MIGKTLENGADFAAFLGGAAMPWLGPALVALAVTVLAFAALWVLSLRLADCSVVDLYWGFGFGVIAWILVGLSGNRGRDAMLLLAMVTLWSARLGLHLLYRHRGSTAEDPRYAEMRTRNGPGWERRSFWMVFMLQAAVMWILALPLHIALGTPSAGGQAPLGLIMLGMVLFAAGFTIEAAADAALVRFKRDPAQAGRLLTTGLFAWSRHPNYFGEALLWWGLATLAFAVSGQWVVFLGPALLTLLLVKVSGIPPLEAHLSARPGFADYVAATSAFIPLPPRARPAATRPLREDGQA